MAKRKEGVMPSPMPQDEKPSGIRVNWKAKAERLETECVALGQSCAAVTDRYNTIRAELDAVRIVAGQHLNLIDGLEIQIKIHESEISRLETVISERANTIERLTVGIDQYQKDIANHVAMADDRSAYIDELQKTLQARSREVSGMRYDLRAMTAVRDSLEEMSNSALDRLDRIPRWVRFLCGVK